jgi:hypothetical protein
MARTGRDTGAISVKGLLKFSLIVFLFCLIFLVMDVRHRMAGYQAVHGHGIQGTATVTRCQSHPFSRFCTGHFTSADGRVNRSGIRVNGAMASLGRERHGARPATPMDHPVDYPAVLASAKADEVWTVDGDPWLRPSMAQVSALVPVSIPVLVAWGLVRGGPRSRRQRLERARLIRSHRHEVARLREIRRGRIS